MKSGGNFTGDGVTHGYPPHQDEEDLEEDCSDKEFLDVSGRLGDGELVNDVNDHDII